MNWGREATVVPVSERRCRTVSSVRPAWIRAAVVNGPAQNARSYGRIPATAANVQKPSWMLVASPLETHSQPVGIRTENRNVAVISGWSKQQNTSGPQSG
jgi:hypothetical protein